MSYNFVEKVSHKQQENAYILYMIISSYFDKCTCLTKTLEDQLSLYYADMSDGKQMRSEDRVINSVYKVLNVFSRELRKFRCDARISRVDDQYVIDFETGIKDVKAVVNNEGKYHIEMIDRELEDAASEDAAPEDAESDGAASKGAAPEGAATKGAAPDGAATESVVPDGAAIEDAMPDEQAINACIAAIMKNNHPTGRPRKAA